ncbi:hypothetical protein GOQ25_03935 [Bordetella sp. 15P40C-2]|nr:hypothetical protein [Bordetella sp. 15P40C-2]
MIEAMMSVAIKSNDVELFKQRVAENSIDLATYRFEDRNTFLHSAIASGSHRIALYLTGLDGDAERPTDFAVQRLLWSYGEGCNTPLQLAVQLRKNPNWVMALLMAGASDYNHSALIWAAEHGHLGIVRMLIRANAHAHLREKLGLVVERVQEHVNAGSYGIALAQAMANAAGSGHKLIVQALINVGARDADGAALKKATDRGHLEIVDTLVDSLAYDLRQLSYAMMYAAQVRDSVIAQRLCAAGANPSLALAFGYEGVAPLRCAGKVGGVGILEELGADASTAMQIALHHKLRPIVSKLSLIGGNIAKAVENAAVRNDSCALHWLLEEGGTATWVQAMKALAQRGDLSALAFLKKKLERRLDTALAPALMRLAKDGRVAAIQVLTRPEPKGQLPSFWRELAVDGDWQALKLLKDSNLSSPETLELLVRERHLAAVKTWVRANIDTATLLHTLHGRYLEKAGREGHEFNDDSWKGMELLILAGADASVLPASVKDRIYQSIASRERFFAGLAPQPRDRHLIRAVQNGSVTDIALLLARDASPIAVLTTMDQSQRKDAIQNLTRAGMDASRILIDCVRNNRIELARHLIDATEPDPSQEQTWASRDVLATQALMRLLSEGDLKTAAAFLPDLTDGATALARYAQMHDDASLTTLVQLGAHASAALLNLLLSEDYAAAGRLIALGADVDTTFMLMYSDGKYGVPDFLTKYQIRLSLADVGAEFKRALLRAAELRELSAARELLEFDDARAFQFYWELARDQSLDENIRAHHLQFLRDAGLNPDKKPITMPSIPQNSPQST